MIEENGGALSVGELTRRVKTLLEEAFPEVWVRGEVSNLRIQSSGHAYFTLKDESAQIAGVMFRGDMQRAGVALRDGMKVAAFGRVTVYEPRGAYQLVVRAVLDDGEGRLRREFDALKARLTAEGLFDAAKKRALPAPARRVAVVTSPTGAALRDFVSVLQRRGWRGRVVVFPVKVQGAGAAAEVAAAVRRAGALGWFDLVVVTRGGGSLEDLWAFNEEPVARAVAGSPVPVISAVGHETDFSLCDFAADVRAETPTGAAELISSTYLRVVDRLESAEERLHDAAREFLENAAQRMDLLEAKLRRHSPAARLRTDASRLAGLTSRLHAAAAAALAQTRRESEAAERRLAAFAPAGRFALARQRTEATGVRLARAVAYRRATAAARVDALEARLRAAGLDATLRRGFAVVKDADGRVLTRAAAISPGLPLALRFADGEAAAMGDFPRG